jgi:hypothetical protein
LVTFQLPPIQTNVVQYAKNCAPVMRSSAWYTMRLLGIDSVGLVLTPWTDIEKRCNSIRLPSYDIYQLRLFRRSIFDEVCSQDALHGSSGKLSTISEECDLLDETDMTFRHADSSDEFSDAVSHLEVDILTANHPQSTGDAAPDPDPEPGPAIMSLANPFCNYP